MCALKPPFNGSNIHQLALQIVKGTYPPIPAQFSFELRNLVQKLLVQEPRSRPNINLILKDRLFTSRIQNYLSKNEFKEEFAHTILHK